MNMPNPEHPHASHETLEKLGARLSSRVDALSSRNMPADWEVVAVRIPRARWHRLLLFKIFGRLRRWRLARRFQSLGRGSSLARPFWLRGSLSMNIGERVTIWQGARLTAVNYSPERTIISIGDGTSIHSNVHISAAKRVDVGRGVLIAANCYITDHDHDWLDPDDPPRFNARLLVTPTSIGDHAWIGEKVAVLRGVTIGAGCVIGAHSVVTRDIPAYSVAVGSPARVVRRWDPEVKAWMKVD
jgi:acetyltransferase-like isoleucine patch superfamily enzyme